MEPVKYNKVIVIFEGHREHTCKKERQGNLICFANERKRVIISHLINVSWPILHFRVCKDVKDIHTDFILFSACLIGSIRERSAGSWNLSNTIKLLYNLKGIENTRVMK